MDYKPFFGHGLLDLLGGMIVLSKKHAAIHSGLEFVSNQSPTSLNNGSSLYFIFVIPTGISIHVHDVFVYINQLSTVEFFKLAGSPTLSSPITPTNYNQLKKIPSKIGLYFGYTGGTKTSIFTIDLPKATDTIQNILTGQDFEVVLGPGTYGISLTAKATAGNVYYKTSWYEEY